jgi:flavonol-3-O-glucoside L-rhamnosyltransferase
VKNRGIVHSGWLQQQLVLKHSSVGCYVCHAGFSSLIEAIVNDCQFVLLPFKGDQFLNSKLIANDLKVGVEVNRKDENGFFAKEDLFERYALMLLTKSKCHYDFVKLTAIISIHFVDSCPWKIKFAKLDLFSFY